MIRGTLKGRLDLDRVEEASDKASEPVGEASAPDGLVDEVVVNGIKGLSRVHEEHKEIVGKGESQTLRSPRPPRRIAR